MKLYMLRGNAFAKETYDFFVENIVIYDFEKDGKLYDVDLYRKFDGPVGWSFYYSVLYVYFYFKGFGVEKDVQFAKDILHNINKYEDWRKFYVPKYFIKDFDFVKFLMKESFGTINGNHFLYLIYSGKFNEEEKNETLANEHFNIYEENLNSCIKRNTIDELDRIKNLINHPRYSETSYNRILMRFYLRKYVFYSFFYDGVFLAPNPYYNIELAKNI